MTDIIHKRIDDLTQVITTMSDNQTLERRESNRIMEKLADGQAELSKQIFAKSAVDTALEVRLKISEELIKTHDKLLTSLLIETTANTESRKESNRLKQKITGTILTILIMGSLFSWLIFKKG